MLKKIVLVILISTSAFSLFSQSEYENIQVKGSFNYSWLSKPAKLVSLINGYQPVSDGITDFTETGCYKYLRTDSTGFYYVKKIDGRWWMVDPNGYAGINMAVNSLSSSNIQSDYDVCLRNGYNGIGDFSSNDTQTRSGYNSQNYFKFSYTPRYTFLANYQYVRKNYYTTPTIAQGSAAYVWVFDPQFEIYCDTQAKTNITPYANDRHLFGWFTDNELSFNQDQLQNLVRDLPAGDPSRDSALVFAASKGLTEADCINYTSKVTEDIKQEFAARLAEKYYKIVTAAVRKYDPNHLILGSRLNGRPRAIPAVVAASQKYNDVTSVNFYDKYSPNEQVAMSTWTNDKPCLVTEFYIKDINRSTTTQSGAGWYVNSQADRGKFYQNSCLELLKNKCYIGWHYFRFDDDTDGSNKGMVNSSKVEYTDMTHYMEELNKQVYRLCDFYDRVNRRPVKDTIARIFDVSEDTYVIPGATNTDNFGTSPELEIRYNSTEANRRDAYLKFDLTSVKSLLPNLKSASLEVNCTQSDASDRAIFTGGLLDKRWSEMTLNGQLRNANSDWKSGYNRLSFVKDAVSLGKMTFNVTNWLYNQHDSAIVSFKIFDLNSLNTSLKIASKENPTNENRPKLKLVFWDYSTSVLTNSTKQYYQVFPNPAQNTLSVEGGFNLIELLSLNGQVLLKTNTNSLDVSGLNKGVYIIKITINDKHEYVYKKVIKE
ncbi:MAG TPA: T9SS type A sorting domain-containing protein [Paludibacter sp.]